MLNKNYLLIGSGGFIGSNILKLLKKKKIKVYKNNFRLKETNKISRFIKKKNIEVVIHLASSLVPDSNKKEYKNEELNIINPSIRLLRFLKKKKIFFIFFSSGGTIYGNKENAKEEDKLIPINYYGFSKKKIENNIVKIFNENEDKYLILRPTNIFGKKNSINTTQGLIENTIESIKKNKTISVINDGKEIRNYIFIEDFIKIFYYLLKLKFKKEILNIASNKNYKTISVIRKIHKILTNKKKIVYKFVTKNKRIRKITLNNSKLCKKIKFKFKDLDYSLKKFIESKKYD
jgi:UDP-glucose 4-epimerase